MEPSIRFTAAEGGARLAAAASAKNTLATEYSSFISTRLVYEDAHKIRGPLSSGFQRSVYVTRESRLRVVAHELALLTDLSVAVGHLDTWHQSSELEDTQVLVCTSPVLQRLLDDKVLSVSNINVLVLDSCHLINTDPSLRCIMDHYKKCEEDKRPRILALTYPLFQSNKKEIETSIINENLSKHALINSEKNDSKVTDSNINTEDKINKSEEIVDNVNSESNNEIRDNIELKKSFAVPSDLNTDNNTAVDSPNVVTDNTELSDVATENPIPECDSTIDNQKDSIVSKLIIDEQEVIKSKSSIRNGVYENLDDFELYEKLEWKIEDLEQKLCCQMDLAEDIDGGKRVSATIAKPKELIIEYSPPPPLDKMTDSYVELDKFMRETVQDAMEFITDHRYDPTEIYGEDMYDEFKNIPDPTADPKRVFQQFIYVLDELGPYAADKAAFALLTKLEKLKVKVPYERHFLLLCLCTSVFLKIRSYADFLFSKYESDWIKVQVFSTPKVLRFAEILEKFEPPELSDGNVIRTGTKVDNDKPDINATDVTDTSDKRVGYVMNITDIAGGDAKASVKTAVSDTNFNSSDVSDTTVNAIVTNVHDDVKTSDKSDSNVTNIKAAMLATIDSCNFLTLGDKIEDRVNTLQANLKDLDDDDVRNETVIEDAHMAQDETKNIHNDKSAQIVNSDAQIKDSLSPNKASNLLHDESSVLVEGTNKTIEAHKVISGARRQNRSRGRGRPQRHNALRLQQLQQNPDALCGIVFMSDALVAKVMFMVIVDISRANPRLNYLCAQYCGDSDTNEPKECLRQGKKQEEVLKKFRMHECNILLATPALEEGIDLPRCNLVLRWDLPPSYRSYGLCRSRARAPRAACSLLAETAACQQVLRHVAVYKELDQIISRKCGCGVQDEPPQEEEDEADSYTHFITPYTPNVLSSGHDKSGRSKQCDDKCETGDDKSRRIDDKCGVISDKSGDNSRNIGVNIDTDNDKGRKSDVNNEILDKSRNTVEKIETSCDQSKNMVVNNEINDDNSKKINEKSNESCDKSGTSELCESKHGTVVKSCENSKSNARVKIEKNHDLFKKSERKPEESASVDLSTAVALINRYCGKLPSDTFTRLAPQWWMERVSFPTANGEKVAYICTLRLPLNCPIKFNIVGHPMPTRVLARRMVALRACAILHKAGELDHQLMPIGKENFKAAEVDPNATITSGCTTNDDSEFARPGTTKRRQYYYKRTAWAFIDCQPVIDTSDSEIAPETKEELLHSKKCNANEDVDGNVEIYKDVLPEIEKERVSKDIQTNKIEIGVHDVQISECKVKKSNRFDDKNHFISKDINKVECENELGKYDDTNQSITKNIDINVCKDKEAVIFEENKEINQCKDNEKDNFKDKKQNIDKINIEEKTDESKNTRESSRNNVQATSKTNDLEVDESNKVKEQNLCNDKDNYHNHKDIYEDEQKSQTDSLKKEEQQFKKESMNNAKLQTEVEEEENADLENLASKKNGKRNLLYAIVSSLWCALPERYNTRGRRLHAPQNARQAIGVLMARYTADSLQIPSFPVYTRSGEVRVSIEHVPDADVRMSPRRGRLVRRFMRFVFSEVLRVRRRGMKLHEDGTTRNNYYIVPTIKTTRPDGSTKIDIDWSFLEVIYQHTEEQQHHSDVERPVFWHQDEEDNECKDAKAESKKEKCGKWMSNPLLKEGETFVFDPEKYREAVVTPWYRNQDQPQFFLVAEICSNLTPDSAFPSATHTSFRHYYNSKYGVTLTQPDQPLLDVDHTSARLNLLTPRYVNRKGVALPVSSERTRRAKRDRLDQKQILVPELCRVHPFAAPLWFATVALPCVLYRINALLIADEIRRSVAIDVGVGIPKIEHAGFQWPPLDFGWSLAEVLNADSEKFAKKKEDDGSSKSEELQDTEDSSENVADDLLESPKEKTLNDILQEKVAGDNSFEIGTWSNDMAASVPEPEPYDEYSEPLPPNLTFCTSAEGGVNWCDPIQKPKSQFNPSKAYAMADSDCSYTSSEFDSDASSECDGSEGDDDDDTSIGSEHHACAAMGVRIEYKTAHEAEAVDVERKKVNPAPQPDEEDDKEDKRSYEKFLQEGQPPTEHIEKFQESVAKHKNGIIGKGSLIHHSEPIVHILPETKESHNKLDLTPKHSTDLQTNSNAERDKLLNDIFPYGNDEIILLDNGQIDLESIERNKRKLMAVLKKSLPEEEIKKLECFSMVDVNIDAKDYVNEKVVNIGFDTKDSYVKRVNSWGKEMEYPPYYDDGKGQKFDFDYQPKLEGHPGPSPSVILQALTMSNANDGINLERLETIGDSFLKFAITAYLYCAHPTVHEGKLSHMRSKQVSNLNLYRLGRNKRLGARMIASKFEPHDNWLPPCHKPPPTLHTKQTTKPAEYASVFHEMPQDSAGCFIPYNLITQHSIPDKSIADCVEALIGAYLLECGPRGALLFMSWLGIRVLPRHEVVLEEGHPYLKRKRGDGTPEQKLSRSSRVHRGDTDSSSDDEETSTEQPEQDWSWPGRPVGSLRPVQREDGVWVQPIFGALKAPPSPLLRYIADPEGELHRMLSGYDALEERLQYRFKDRSLLLQAMSHASHQPNRLTDCYQRLEFLGDAILDYLITRHLYLDPRRHSPGALTDLRSALVNNTIFATLAARHGFHKYFRHMSPGLNEVLTKYVKIQEENGHSISEEHYLIQEDELEQAEDVEVPKALGDLFESVAGAIFLDSGMSLQAVWQSYERLMGAELEAFSAAAPKSPVRELLEAEPDTAKFGKPERLADGRRVRVCVEVFGRGAFKGVGRNYRIAKGTAARCALRHLKIHRAR